MEKTDKDEIVSALRDEMRKELRTVIDAFIKPIMRGVADGSHSMNDLHSEIWKLRWEIEYLVSREKVKAISER